MKKRRHPIRNLLIFIIIIALLAIYLFWQNTALQTENFEVALSNGGEGLDGLKIVQLTDLHCRSFGEGNSELIKAVRAAGPDIIAVTGDVIDEVGDITVIETLIPALTAIAPVYYVTGNHEWSVENGVSYVDEVFGNAGATVLHNGYVLLEKDGDPYIVAGIDDPCGRADMITPEDFMAKVRAENGGVPVILLAHRNDAEEYGALGAELVLSGHAHGGIVRVPFTNLSLIGPNREWLPKYASGLFRFGESQVFIGRGLGNSVVNFRLFNRPQVAVLTIKTK